jgi:hypothetical protein
MDSEYESVASVIEPRGSSPSDHSGNMNSLRNGKQRQSRFTADPSRSWAPLTTHSDEGNGRAPSPWQQNDDERRQGEARRDRYWKG